MVCDQSEEDLLFRKDDIVLEQMWLKCFVVGARRKLGHGGGMAGLVHGWTLFVAVLKWHP